MAKVYAWYKDNAMVVQLGTPSAPLMDEITGAVQTTAVVNVRVQTESGTDVAGTWPVSMPHASGGIYRATVDALALTERTKFVAKITATVGTIVATWYASVVFVKRTPA